MHIVPAIDPVFEASVPPIPAQAIRAVALLAVANASPGNVHDRASREVLLTRVTDLLGWRSPTQATLACRLTTRCSPS